jgi:F0F1-type ATP synthase gamma subunit
LLRGDLTGLARRALALWLCASFYGIMLRSAVAEHTARCQLLEGAVRNAQQLREDLALQLQQARQEAITAERQDLMAGAGLVGISTVADSARSR